MLHRNNTPCNETTFSDRFVCSAEVSILTYLLIVVLFVGASTARGQVSAQKASAPSVASRDQPEPQEAPDSTTGTQASYASDLTATHEPPSRMVPMTELDN